MDKEFTTKEDMTSLIRFKDEAVKKKYKDIVESMLYSQRLISVSTYIIAEANTYTSQGEEPDDQIKQRHTTLLSEFPELEGVDDPTSIAEMFRASMINDALELAILVLDASSKNKIECTNIHEVLVPLVFSDEGGISATEQEVEDLIEELENVNVKSIAKA